MKIEDLYNLSERASPGPWGTRGSDGTAYPKGDWVIEEFGHDLSLVAGVGARENADFIVAARNLMLPLLDIASAARAQVDTWDKVLKLSGGKIVVTIGGLEMALDLTAEVKAALDALEGA